MFFNKHSFLKKGEIYKNLIYYDKNENIYLQPTCRSNIKELYLNQFI